MSRFVRTTFCLFILSCLMSMSRPHSSGPTCSTSDENQMACSSGDGSHGITDTRDRNCFLSPPESYHPIDSSWSNSCGTSNAYSPVCPGFVGMDLTFTCNFPNAQVCNVKNGTCVNGSINYGYLLPEHAGVYECRNSSSLRIVSAQNITVSEEVRIGGPDRRCFRFSADCSNECCKWTNEAFPPNNNKMYKQPLQVYGQNVTVEVDLVEWLVDTDTRSKTDLGISVEQDMMDLLTWNVIIRHTPSKITTDPPLIMFRVTARNSISKHSVCINTQFTGSNAVVSVENETLPLSTEVIEGHDATFQCKFSASKLSESQFSFGFELRKYTLMANGTQVTDTFNTSYYINDDRYYPACTNCPFTVNLSKPIDDHQSSVLQFDIYMVRVTKDFNESTFSCSILLLHDEPETLLLQWKRVATLSVVQAQVNPDSNNNIKYVSLISLLVVFVLVAMVVVPIAALIYKRRKHQQQSTQVNPDEVPLRCSSVHSSQSTLIGSEANTPVIQHARVPCIEIADTRGSQPGGLLVREECPRGQIERHSNGRSWIAVNSSIENFLVQSQTNGVQHSPPTSLQLNDIPHNRIDISESYYDTSQLEKFVIYISYTDQKARWVRNTLKPQIKSLHSAIEVNLHESSMIPGFAVSSERQRLILEADKVIIVVSQDYPNSPWCLFELEHAIHQNPALCNGRVIPILTDNCTTLPSIISGAVYLTDQENNFLERLRLAIFKKPLSFL